MSLQVGIVLYVRHQADADGAHGAAPASDGGSFVADYSRHSPRKSSRLEAAGSQVAYERVA